MRLARKAVPRRRSTTSRICACRQTNTRVMRRPDTLSLLGICEGAERGKRERDVDDYDDGALLKTRARARARRWRDRRMKSRGS